MKLYLFKSETRENLRAFTADAEGAQLPLQFKPWHAVGVVRADSAPPHKLGRADIERAIQEQGFQLWRLKSDAVKQSPA